MKTKRDPRVDTYIAKSADFARPILRHLRRLAHAACPEVQETIKWGMPSFVHVGGILCILAAFKAHCAVVFWHREMKRVIGVAPEAKPGRGTFGRITALSDLPGEKIMLGYFKQAAKLNESGVPARPRPAAKRKTALRVPPDLAEALRKNKAAAKTFDAFSTTKRRDYVEWISEAKRDETRRTRLATAIEWLAAGKSRHWKYENC